VKKEKLMVVDEGVTAKLVVRKDDPVPGCYGKVEFCGLDSNGTPFKLVVPYNRLMEIAEALEALAEEVCPKAVEKKAEQEARQ